MAQAFSQFSRIAVQDPCWIHIQGVSFAFPAYQTYLCIRRLSLFGPSWHEIARIGHQSSAEGALGPVPQASTPSPARNLNQCNPRRRAARSGAAASRVPQRRGPSAIPELSPSFLGLGEWSSIASESIPVVTSGVITAPYCSLRRGNQRSTPVASKVPAANQGLERGMKRRARLRL